MPNEVLVNIDERIRELQADLEYWEKLRALIASRPSQLADTQGVLFDPKGNGLLNPARFSALQMVGANRVQQVHEFFKKNDNKYHNVRQIAQGTGLSTGTVRDMVHYRYAPLFERNRIAQNNVKYRLSQTGLELTDFENLPRGPRPPGYAETHRRHNAKVRARRKEMKRKQGRKPIPSKGGAAPANKGDEQLPPKPKGWPANKPWY